MPQLFETIHTTDLWYTAGSSDKEYHARIQKDSNGTFSVPFSYGRRGTAGALTRMKCMGVSYGEARRVYVSLIKSKMKKGYVPNSSGQPKSNDYSIEDFETSVLTTPAPSVAFSHVPSAWNGPTGMTGHTGTASPPTSKKSRPAPQLLNEITEEEMLALLENPEWGAQEKYDGKRMTVDYEREGPITAFNKKGEECPHPADLDPDLVALATSETLGKFVFDGELADGVFHVFDVLSHQPARTLVHDVRRLPYDSRHSKVEHWLQGLCLDRVKLAPLARTTAEKKALLKRLRKEGKEGIVFKKLNARYTSGRPNSGGDQLKYKFYATASVIINKVNTKSSVNMMVLDGNEDEVVVGNCTVPAAVKPSLRTGIIIEVRYLYAYPGGSLYQPVYLGIRDDVDREECVITQLKYKGVGEKEKAPQRRILWK